MIELEKQIETALTEVLADIDGLNVRAYLVDDTIEDEIEPLTYPYCALAASPADPVLEGEILYNIDVRLVIATNALQDTKRAELSALLSAVRNALTASAIDEEAAENVGIKQVSFTPEEPEAEELEQREILTAHIAFVAIEQQQEA